MNSAPVRQRNNDAIGQPVKMSAKKPQTNKKSMAMNFKNLTKHRRNTLITLTRSPPYDIIQKLALAKPRPTADAKDCNPQ